MVPTSKSNDELAIKELLASDQKWVRRFSELNEVCLMKAQFEEKVHYLAHITKERLGTGKFHWVVAEMKRPFSLKNVLYHSGKESSLKDAVTKVDATLKITALQKGASPHPVSDGKFGDRQDGEEVATAPPFQARAV